jgi:hypothetical protein
MCAAALSRAAATASNLKDDFIVDLKHLAETELLQAFVSLDSKHRAHHDVGSAT